MAHKKGGGSTHCGRDSQSKRLGVKKFGGSKFVPEISWFDNEAPVFYPEITSV